MCRHPLCWLKRSVSRGSIPTTTPFSLAITCLAARAQMGLPLDEAARAAARYLALTADEVRAAFAKSINPDRFVQVVRGPVSP
jgi:hypothetical protein